MDSKILKLLLADDDKDDCLLFKEALEEIPIAADLTIVHDGEQLMQYLWQTKPLPSALFLDLNMPRKNGFECLEEIRQHAFLKKIPVIIISTSFDEAVSQSLFEKGANHYICKPTEFEHLKKALFKALSSADTAASLKPDPENFVLYNES
jgi:CheY-like chemotaxis protein